ATYRANLKAECHQAVLRLDNELPAGAEVIIGGPPCKPFSVNGHQNGRKDERGGFPAFPSPGRRFPPPMGGVENARGMLYQNRAYFQNIVEQLHELGYNVDQQLLNAVDYGVPQNRERLFVVAHHGGWDFPEPTHRARPVTAGEALGELAHAVPPGA